MAIEVFWTQTALNNLKTIFEYHKNKASVKTARNLVKRIVKATYLLRTAPEMGRIEELLSHRKHQYRFIVEGNYKIIYWIEDNIVKIATVFDTRQDPGKLKRI